MHRHTCEISIHTHTDSNRIRRCNTQVITSSSPTSTCVHTSFITTVLINYFPKGNNAVNNCAVYVYMRSNFTGTQQ